MNFIVRSSSFFTAFPGTTIEGAADRHRLDDFLRATILPAA
jgi:hypothetical protein